MLVVTVPAPPSTLTMAPSTIRVVAPATPSTALLVDGLRAVLVRFGGYDTRFAAALARAEDGDVAWVDGTDVDSCHRVWFELHEDLIATLGRSREGAG